MNNYETLSAYTRDELIELIELYSRNWLALDGVWFQSVEQKLGMDEAMYHDAEAWKRFTVTEARRIKSFLKLPEHPGIDGLERALRHRFCANVNPYRIDVDGDALTYTVLECRVQSARARKGMPYHPCKSVGLEEYSGFGRTIDSRLKCECLRCYPDPLDETCSCQWRFTLVEDEF